MIMENFLEILVLQSIFCSKVIEVFNNSWNKKTFSHLHCGYNVTFKWNNDKSAILNNSSFDKLTFESNFLLSSSNKTVSNFYMNNSYSLISVYLLSIPSNKCHTLKLWNEISSRDARKYDTYCLWNRTLASINW